MKKAIITIGGSLGSGKSSTAKTVAVKLDYKHYSSGDVFREMAAKRNETIEGINISAETQKDIDGQVDGWLQQLYRTEDRFVVDSRMAWHWMPESFKVYLSLDIDTAAERVFQHMKEVQRVSESGSSIEEVKASLVRRNESEQKRYFDLYGVRTSDPANYDLVIDTKNAGLESVVDEVLKGYETWRIS